MPNLFSENCFQPIVKSFVSSVILFDDQLSTDEQTEIVTTLNAPKPGENSSENTESEKEIEQGIIENIINIPSIIKDFAEENYLLTAINPKIYKTVSKAECKKILFSLALKADVIILDWEMNLSFSDGDYSGAEFATEIIKHLEQDNKYRLLFVYTKEKKQTVIEDLPPHKIIEIKVFRKKSFESQDESTKDYKSLAKEITKEYLKNKKGIISACLLKSLCKLRSSTYEMLNSLDKSYDEALFYHRFLLENPDKIIDFGNEIINDEILSYLGNTENSELLAPDIFMKYFEEMNSIDIYCDLTGKGKRTKLSNEDLLSLITEGYSKYIQQKIPEGKESDAIIGLISHGKQLENFFNRINQPFMKDFSSYTSLLNKSIRPCLKLGCIVKKQNMEDSADEYFLCIQPPCDSERVPMLDSDGKCSNPRNFIFLKLEDKSSPDFYVKKENGDNIKLRINYKEIYTFSFAGNKKEMVTMDESGIFKTYPLKYEFKYVAALKPMFAQKIANNFAAYISRVGLDEFEWQRLKRREE